MKTWIKILLAVVVIILILQLPIFSPEKNYSKAEPVDDIALKYDVPMNVLMDLNESCYVCHSNYTEDYPWYYSIQPISWWMNKHIEDAKDDLNLTEFAKYPPKKAAKKFKEIKEVMDERTMPIRSYLWMHDEAKMNDKQYKRVAKWAEKQRKELLESM